MSRTRQRDSIIGAGPRRPRWLVVIALALIASAVPVFLLPPMARFVNATVYGALIAFVGFILLRAGPTLAASLAAIVLGLGTASVVLVAETATPVASPGLVVIYAVAFALLLLGATAWRLFGPMRRMGIGPRRAASSSC